jgi:carboxy-cis,cis-muconate cyclase
LSLSSTGEIEKQLFLTETTSSGGAANSVAPADFSDEWVALTDSEVGAVEIWQLTTNGSAKIVASLSIQDKGCCANAIWYD